MLGFLGGFFGFLMVFSLIVAIVTMVANYKLFEKAGVEGWKAIIPIYNLYVTIQIAFSNKKNWLIIVPFLSLFGFMFGESLAALIPLLVSAVYIYISYSFIRRFAGTGASIASLFFPVIMYPIIGFSSKYQYEEY